jgi:hypothetical protein
VFSEQSVVNYALSVLERQAIRIYPLRWRLLACFIGAYALLYLGVYLAGQVYLSALNWKVLFAIGVPALVWLWGLICLANWFHPERGTLRVGSPWFLGAPRIVQDGLRACGVVGLAFWFGVPLLTLVLVLVR